MPWEPRYASRTKGDIMGGPASEESAALGKNKKKVRDHWPHRRRRAREDRSRSRARHRCVNRRADAGGDAKAANVDLPSSARPSRQRASRMICFELRCAQRCSRRKGKKVWVEHCTERGRGRGRRQRQHRVWRFLCPQPPRLPSRWLLPHDGSAFRLSNQSHQPAYQ
jgi:hypothetical protein